MDVCFIYSKSKTDNVQTGEKIHAHVVSVWRESKGFFAVGGREGMLFLTDRHLMFIHKTESGSKWWEAIRQRQVVKFIRSKNTMIRHDGYDEEDLSYDLEDERNVEIPIEDVTHIDYKDESWGSVLNIEYETDDGRKKHSYTVAQDWVKYPAKEPTKYMKVDWQPFVEFVREQQRRI